MQLTALSPQIIIWVSIVFSIFVPCSSMTPRSSEIDLLCGPSQNASSASETKSFLPNIVKVMEAVQMHVVVHRWGYDSVSSPPPTVYGFGQCHSDLSDLDCKLCFSQGRVKLPGCLLADSARIYLDGCYLRYDNYSFNNESIDPRYDYVNCSKPTGLLSERSSQDRFQQKVVRLIDNVTEMAVRNGTFAVAHEDGGLIHVFALAQCWSTLDEVGCIRCLMAARSKLKQCVPGSEGRALFTGCFVRYSTEKFFDTFNEDYASNNGVQHSEIGTILVVAMAAAAFLVLSAFGAFIGYQRLSKRKEVESGLRTYPGGSHVNFKYEVLEKATDSFDDSKKLGQGGAASVYKGTLADGRIVAVKRLVYNTRQWVDQFFNEVNLISNIQHDNLVRLLGCSIEGPESLLVYEYVPNRSLDQILFVKNTIQILTWQQRFNIILGTAEGLAYLHGGAGEKIIHRDIKTSNILLDEDLTPKIADFGLARCVADNSHIGTGVAGTLGYMAPEYLIRGQLTEKADVYGFGVVVLEIATGKKNSVFSLGSSSILTSVWKHYKSDSLYLSLDPCLRGVYLLKQAKNVLQIGLLCTQASASLRPSMAEIVHMLTDCNSEIPSPKQPPFSNASVLDADDNPESYLSKLSHSQTTALHHNSVAPLPSSDSLYYTGSVGPHPSIEIDSEHLR